MSSQADKDRADAAFHVGMWTTPRTKDDPAGGPKARWGWWYTP